jgi:hypothetical protein
VASPSAKSASAAGSGIGFGMALAMVISYTTYHHIGWAILHAIFNWFYVVYYLLTGGSAGHGLS